MRIFIDMDDICVNLLHEWLITLNQLPNVVSQTESDIVDWDMKLAYPMLTPNQVYSPLYNAEMWKRVQPIEGAYKYMKRLIDEGNEVYIATASYPDSYFIKTTNCLLKHFDFLTPKNIICIHSKFLLDGDVLFDDYHENLRKFKGVKVLRNRPYNVNCDEECYHFRVDKWEEFYNICQEIRKVKEGVYFE